MSAVERIGELRWSTVCLYSKYSELYSLQYTVSPALLPSTTQADTDVQVGHHTGGKADIGRLMRPLDLLSSSRSKTFND